MVGKRKGNHRDGNIEAPLFHGVLFCFGPHCRQGMQDLSSLSRDQTQAPCSGSPESYPPDHQGSPWSLVFLLKQNICIEESASWACSLVNFHKQGPLHERMLLSSSHKGCKYPSLYIPAARRVSKLNCGSNDSYSD